jgi:glycosyltransferase involved in cell wall biosynthesis
MSNHFSEARVLGVVVPAYNEEATIGEILRRVEALPCVREIVVVDDCSQDRTADIVQAIHSPRIRLIRQPRNQGKTAAVRRGIAEITAPLTIVQDADLEYDPSEIPFVIAPILAGQADVVYGSRFIVRKAARVLYFHHYVANKTLTFLSNLLTNLNLTDIETCYKAFRTPVLQRMPLTSSGFGMEVEITAMVAKAGARMYEVPISYYGRTYEEGKKIGYIDGVHALGYVFYYNVLSPLEPARRQYLRSIRQWLSGVSNPAGAPASHAAALTRQGDEPS